MSHTMNLDGINRITTIMTALANKPCHVSGAYLID